MLAITVPARSLHGLKFPDDLEALAKSFAVPADKMQLRYRGWLGSRARKNAGRSDATADERGSAQDDQREVPRHTEDVLKFMKVCCCDHREKVAQ
jgi:hypothetical protein